MPCSAARRRSTTAGSALMSIGWLTRTPRLIAEATRPPRGVIDTSVVIDLDRLDPSRLPVELAVTADERAVRRDRLQRTEAAFDAVPFDGEAARAYGRVYAAVSNAGRKARGTRAVDLLIAATACAAGLPLITRNPTTSSGSTASWTSSRSDRLRSRPPSGLSGMGWAPRACQRLLNLR